MTVKDGANFDEWVILECFGHRRIAGHATESTILPGNLIRIDIPNRAGNYVTQYIGASSIYSMTVTNKETASLVALNSEPEPVGKWEIEGMMSKQLAFNAPTPENDHDNDERNPDDEF